MAKQDVYVIECLFARNTCDNMTQADPYTQRQPLHSVSKPVHLSVLHFPFKRTALVTQDLAPFAQIH